MQSPHRPAPLKKLPLSEAEKKARNTKIARAIAVVGILIGIHHMYVAGTFSPGYRRDISKMEETLQQAIANGQGVYHARIPVQISSGPRTLEILWAQNPEMNWNGGVYSGVNPQVVSKNVCVDAEVDFLAAGKAKLQRDPTFDIITYVCATPLRPRQKATNLPNRNSKANAAPG
jgi:hypothetical protein